jgi:hypothetical protein
MPRSLWVIEVLAPKIGGRGREWCPWSFEATKREAVYWMRARERESGNTCRVRRWAPVEAGR